MQASQTPTLYLLPGLGVDGRVFRGLKAAGLAFEVLEWLPPGRREPYADYLRRMAAGIDTSRPFHLGGVSFGGMVCMDLCKTLSPEKVIILSAPKVSREFPWYLRTFRYFPVQKVLPGRSFFWLSHLARPFTYGVLKHEVAVIRQKFLVESDPALVKWSVNAAVQWKNTQLPERILHIHGDKDALFPYRFIGESEVIKGGNHLMVLERAEEIAKLMRRFLGEG